MKKPTKAEIESRVQQLIASFKDSVAFFDQDPPFSNGS